MRLAHRRGTPAFRRYRLSSKGRCPIMASSSAILLNLCPISTSHRQSREDMTRPEESNQPPGDVWPIIKAQPRSFFKTPLCTNLDELDFDVAIIGVPFDQGTFGRPGPDSVSTPSGTLPEATTIRTPTVPRPRPRGVTTSMLKTSCCGALPWPTAVTSP